MLKPSPKYTFSPKIYVLYLYLSWSNYSENSSRDSASGCQQRLPAEVALRLVITWRLHYIKNIKELIGNYIM